MRDCKKSLFLFIFTIFALFYSYTYNNLHKHTSLMTLSKKTKPMNRLIYQSIMGEYLIDPNECLENINIQKAISMNDEVMLRKILECEY